LTTNARIAIPDFEREIDAAEQAGPHPWMQALVRASPWG
jgi:hypothetical protein